MASLYMETTEITQLLVAHGATGIASKYEGRIVESVHFQIPVNGREVPFKLPCRTDSVFKTLQSRRATAYRWRAEKVDRERAPRVAWRQMLRWVQAQLALVETGMVQIEEVFLPYVALKGGETMYERVAKQEFLQLEDHAAGSGHAH